MRQRLTCFLVLNFLHLYHMDNVTLFIKKQNKYFAEGFVKIIQSKNSKLIDRLLSTKLLTSDKVNGLCKNAGYQGDKSFQSNYHYSILDNKFRGRADLNRFKRKCCYLKGEIWS